MLLRIKTKIASKLYVIRYNWDAIFVVMAFFLRIQRTHHPRNLSSRGRKQGNAL